MNIEEAHSVLVAELARYRMESYQALQRLLGTQDAYEVAAPSGAEYQIEIQAFWDGKQGGDLRVVGAVDDGSWRALKPLSDDFIMTPTGAFVGE
jgi:hypothetical protein